MILLAALVLLGFFSISIYNGLISKRIACDSAWSQIDVQLKRRHDLIPNLVETVKGYASHEKDTLEKVIKARSAAVSASGSQNVKEQIQAEGALTGALRQLFAVAEAYPDLKANQNFAQLQGELTSTENQISAVRQAYNESVQIFNTAVEQLPGNLIAGFGNFPRRSFFELDAAEKTEVQAVPKVSFS